MKRTVKFLQMWYRNLNHRTPGEALVLFTGGGGGSPGAVKTDPNSADKPP